MIYRVFFKSTKKYFEFKLFKVSSPDSADEIRKLLALANPIWDEAFDRTVDSIKECYAEYVGGLYRDGVLVTPFFLNGQDSWRLWGVATERQYRGQGCCSHMIRKVKDFVIQNGGENLTLNVDYLDDFSEEETDFKIVSSLYKKHGFVFVIDNYEDMYNIYSPDEVEDSYDEAEKCGDYLPDFKRELEMVCRLYKKTHPRHRKMFRRCHRRRIRRRQKRRNKKNRK
jgi:ribosomal protein S18 acetylase RimI-like enzyme